jgi:uncharacterized damage-inducible protein DinB
MTIWTAPAVDRKDEPKVGDELTLLSGWLDYHRDTLLTKCAGLTAEQLKRPSVEPSNLTLLGLVRHMALVERTWFRLRAAGEDVPWLYSTDDNLDGDFDDVAEADAEADFATYLAELDAVRATAAKLDLDQGFTTSRGDFSVRWVYLHMIEEYARHNGHADFLRERIDGATGD